MTHDSHRERIANTISRDPEKGTWPAEAEAQRVQAAAQDRVNAAAAAERAEQTITITMEETCHYSYTYTVADLAERLGCEATPEAVHAALNGDDLADDDAVDEALNDHMEQSGFDYSEGRRYKNDAAALLA